MRVELGDVHVAGDLRTMQQVLERVTQGLADITDARNRTGPEL